MLHLPAAAALASRLEAVDAAGSTNAELVRAAAADPAAWPPGAVFGGPLPGRPDAVVGHRLEQVTITDPEVVALSGSAVHPMLVPTGDGSGEVAGTLLELDDEQLAAADAYEVDAYRRAEVPLRSGGNAWVYVLA